MAPGSLTPAADELRPQAPRARRRTECLPRISVSLLSCPRPPSEAGVQVLEKAESFNKYFNLSFFLLSGIRDHGGGFLEFFG